MADTNTIQGNLDVQGNLRVRGSVVSALPRANLIQDDLSVFPVAPNALRVWDDFATVLPATSSADDLGVYTGTFGTGTPYVATSDLKTAGATTRYARFIIMLPHCWVTDETINLRISAGMLTHVADVSATLDVECYRSAKDGTITGSDLCNTAAQSINSLTFANKSFEILTSTLTAGDVLDFRLTVAVNDAASGSAVIAALGAIELLCDVKG